MRNNYLTSIFFLIFSVNIYAQGDTTLSGHFQPSKQTCQKALEYYMISLTYENEGVIQSAIENIMKIKCHYSELNYNKVLFKLQQLAENAKSNDTRTMAFICGNYLSIYNPSNIEKQKTRELLALIKNR
jgi:hypothetical protein